MSKTTEWDETLPHHLESDWSDWIDSLESLKRLHIPRAYSKSNCYDTKQDVLIYSDASEKAISAVAYLRSTHSSGEVETGFLLGKSKLAPSHGHTIPRLELCAAVLAVDIGQIVSDQLNIDLNTIQYFTDSRVVLGYLNNRTRRFYVYVGNRVERIRTVSSPSQWKYVRTDLNPADLATRGIAVENLSTSPWLLGPLKSPIPPIEGESFKLFDPENDKELRPEVTTLKTEVSEFGSSDSERFQRFSDWSRLVRAFANLKLLVRAFISRNSGQQSCLVAKSVELFQETELWVIKKVQSEAYNEEIDCLSNDKTIPANSSILALSPILDKDGILRVGGRLNKSNLHFEVRNPMIIPGKSHVARLLIHHHHEKVLHQGRHFTSGAVRAAGMWITGCSKLVSSLCHKCVKCRKLRARTCQQKMADLPPERLTPAPPFSYVGLDTFGHWNIVTRRTRGGTASGKRWAIIFVCLVTRAIHIEVVDEMSSSAFINAFRRFLAIRGPVRQLRSDRGTNFVGALKDLNINAVNVEDEKVKNFLFERGIEWLFNPPHSSHMGGSWERMIGICRRILDSMFMEISNRNLTHDVLITFMAEVTAIVNSRPLVPVSNDPQSPFILTPNILLTQKCDLPVEPFNNSVDSKDMYRVQWKRVQALAEMFWSRWRQEYLHLLQPRRKWKCEQPNLLEGDLVLLVDKNAPRNDWPTGLIVKTLPSSDGYVRKAIVRVVRGDTSTCYTRPVTELIHLMSKD